MKPLAWILALSLRAFAAPDPWQALGRIAPHQSTMVQTVDGVRHKGWFDAFTDNIIRIETRRGFETIERGRVKLITARLTSRSQSARKGALVGGGGGVGLLVLGRAPGLSFVVPIFAGLGALIGLSQNTMTPVYRKP
jgi:hypothetical protein